MRDEKLIREVFNSKGGWKFYFDDYLGDGRFYFEEFGKQYSMIGEMLLWCRGTERLGLNELGYGYTGKGGATLRRYLESIVSLGYPRVELPAGRPHYPKVTMGDAKGSRLQGAPPYVFQHAIVDGVLPNGSGGEAFWIAANMNGRDHENAKVDKMLTPHWFEIAHARWPEARRLPRHVPGSRCQVPGRTATAFTTEGTEHTEKDEASSFQRTRLCRPLRTWRPLRFRSLPLPFTPHSAFRTPHWI